MSQVVQAVSGMNMDSVTSSVKSGEYTYALNALVENFDGNSYSLQNEEGNVFTTTLPYKVIGVRTIPEKNLIVIWSTNDVDSEIGTVDINTGTYTKKINSPCIGLHTSKPILKSIHKISNCTTEVYWTDGGRRKWIDLDNLPFKQIPNANGCDFSLTSEIDCNKLLVQPNFSIPQLVIESVDSDGELEAGTVQFGIQYANAYSEAYTSVYSITNPLSLFDPNKLTQDFNYKVNKSVNIDISNIDITGFYDYFNLIVIKTINNISTPYLINTFPITKSSQKVSYTGQNKTEIVLTMMDVFEKYPIYDSADDLTAAQDVLIWKGITTSERISYQSIWNKIQLKWQTHRIKSEKPYAEELNVVEKKGYFRDEIYAFEGVFLLKNGHQTDRFLITSRPALPTDLEYVFNLDVHDPVSICESQVPLEKWKVYNTAFSTAKTTNTDPCYEGLWEEGEFAYWESTEKYPCNKEIWGNLADKPIRHHKFPDSVVSHIHDEQYIYPLGIKFDNQQLIDAIAESNLTAEQKANIVGFKITRGNRANNKSVVARGLINNVGTYTRHGSKYLYPNYPFNDLRSDPFIDSEENSVLVSGGDGGVGTVQDLSCVSYTLKNTSVDPKTYTYYKCGQTVTSELILPGGASLEICQDKSLILTNPSEITLFSKNKVCGTYEEVDSTVISGISPLNGFTNNNRYTLHSPDTSFYQPSLGNLLKLETAEFGNSLGHFTEVKDHAKYRFMSDKAIVATLAFSTAIGFASGAYGIGSTAPFNGVAAWTVFQVVSDLIFKLLPKKNFAQQYNSVGVYNKFALVENTGYKQRGLDIATYANPGMISTGDDYILNNYQRESSVYLKTLQGLPFVSDLANVPTDNSRFTLGDEGLCNNKSSDIIKDISSYYATVKKQFDNQYGYVFSYESVDTGYQYLLEGDRFKYIFGGDCFINKFAYKQKLPFFIDNRVKTVDEADIFYNEIGNIGFPKYWFSTDIKRGSLSGLFGVKDNKFDCKGNNFFYDSGVIYLFSYGIPYFWCESEVNVDLRQAYNGKEGDFFPRVGSAIPDEWLQESSTSIQEDNTYFYNKTYSKQNKENVFTELPLDYTSAKCTQVYPYRAIMSEKQVASALEKRNNWLIYRPAARFDFPQNNGKLISIDGIESKQVLARFENKMLLYNAMLTMPTSAANVYLGQSLFSQEVPPLDYSDTDMGYAGTQHKFFLKTEMGHVSVDAKRGSVFLIQGQQAKDISGNISKFLTEFLNFEIQKAFPEYNIDNHFNGCGLTGVYDSKYDRLILTKIDYKPLMTNIIYKNGVFVKDSLQIALEDTRYFCNNSFTLSYSFKTQSWVSFHSYIPNYYVGNSNYFYTGINNSTSLWKHNTSIKLFNNFYGNLEPYVIEYPLYFKGSDEILQSIKDYSKILKYSEFQEFIETDDVYFSEAVIYNNQQCSGTLKLTKKPKNSLSTYNTYPVYSSDHKEILFTKSNSTYQFNTFWALQKNSQSPMWLKSCKGLSIYKELNQENMNYSKRSFNKAPIMAKDSRIRLTSLEDEYKFISQFLIVPTQTSHK